MARAYPHSEQQDFGQPDASEWQDLRGELVALLDQVEDQVARTARPETGYANLAERMRDLRHQVTEIAPETRHREALRSVQRAVNRFSDRDERAAGPRDSLETAIQQIRSRHFGPREAPGPSPAPRFDELADAIGDVSARLERLEGELKTHARGQSANVKDIADQVGQLSHVVELLAGAVGETGQVKRLEAQIGGLARLVQEGKQADLAALNRRLDDVAQTVAKLAELQKHYADRSDTTGVAQRLDDVTATVGRLADLQVQFANRVEAPKDGLRDAIKAVESGVRDIYDRIDAIEKAVGTPPAELEKITAELARFAAAMKAPQQPQGLIELIDALNVRISDIETRSVAVGGLKEDIGALRDTVLEALEPRFAALETRLEALSDAAGSRGSEPGIAQLEAQVRQLVARMDQTGEQLTGLARLYSQPAEGASTPDYEQIADLVAERTSAAVARHEPAPAGPAGLDEAGLAEIEKRFSRAMKAAASERPADPAAGFEATIREVNERLGRLESVLGRPATPAFAPAPRVVETPPAPVAPEPPRAPKPSPAAAGDDPIAPIIAAFEAAEEPAAAVAARPEPDAMPANPGDDAPLVDAPFGDPNPVRAALEAKNGPRKRHPGLEEPPQPPRAETDRPPPPTPGPGFEPEPAAEAAAPQPKAAEAAPGRPPQPRSSLEMPMREPVRPSATADEPAAPNRNTFIAAHRRAARLAAEKRGEPAAAAPDAPAAAGGNSLIARALARFQTGKPAAPAAADDAIAAPKAKADKAKPEKARPAKDRPAPAERKLAGDKDPPTSWRPDDDEAPRVLPAAPEPSWVSLGAEATSPPPDAAEGTAESFLVRHRQPILLAASVVALAFLTLNLIGQRMAETDPASSTATVDTGEATLQPVPMAEQGDTMASAASGPRVIPMIDSLATASIDPAAADGFDPAAPQDMPPAFVAAEALAGPGPAAATDVAALTPLAETLPPLAVPIASPVKVEMPPEAIGPLSLRQAAANGDARAQFEVAAIYTEGRAVPEDLAQAAVWYERAAGQGFAPAQYRLGNLYETGKGVPTDLLQARLWYQRAAEAGNRMAMHNLAALYAGGGLGTQQFDAAAKWFEEAASRGMKDSQFNLGMLYARGLGVEQNLAQSWTWFSLAAEKGDADAAKAREDVAASLDAATVSRLADELRAWRPAPIDLVANFAPIGTWTSDFDPGAPIAEPKVVTGVQRALTQLGFDVGTPDGLAGPRTAQAIRAFERATGMNESGTINPRLLAVLGSQPV